MSTKLFKNTEGKVLMSVGNKLIKQPYEFGLAFQNRMGLNNYFEVSNINLPSTWSFLSICNVPTGSDSGLISAISTSLNLADNLIVRGGSNGINLFNFIDTVTFNSQKTSSVATSLRYAHSTPNYWGFFSDDSKGIVTISSPRTDGLRDKLRVGVTGPYTANSITPVYYLASDVKLNLIYIFDRELTAQECIYFRNNLLYNDLQSTNGLIHAYKFNIAEDINNLPSIRDLVGTSHLEIKNLPAGTVQQKVDYVNANLFVPFQ